MQLVNRKNRVQKWIASFSMTLTLFTVCIPSPETLADQPVSVSRVLRSASELDYPPFAIVQPDGTADGFSVELLRAATEAAGLDVSFKIGSWNEIKEELATGTLDALPLVSYSAERRKIYDFTAPYLRMNGTVFIRKDGAAIKSLSDLKDKEVLVMRGDTAHEYIVREKLSDKIIPTVSYEEAFKLLAEGRHDAVVVQQVVGLQMVKRLGLKNIIPAQQKNVTTLKPLTLQLEGFEQKFCFAVRKGNSLLLSQLNEGLAVTYLNGTYEKLYEKWFAPILPKPGFTSEEVIKKLLVVIVPLLLVFSFVGIGYLKVLVAERTRFLEDEIAHRKQIQSELAETNLLYVEAERIGKLGNWEFDIEKQIFTGSDGAKRVYGFKSDTTAITVDEMDSCLFDTAESHGTMMQSLARGIPCHMDVEILTKDNRARRTVQFIARLVRDESGRPVAIRGVIQDISERKRMGRAPPANE